MASEQDSASFPVSLNIYDLSQGMARQLSVAFLGTPIDAIYHTGVVVYGKEYWFGNGIERGVAGRTYFGSPLRTMSLGETSVPEDLFEEFLSGVKDQFNPSTYSLLRNNCNHFSDEAAQFLVGRGIPREIVDLPNVVLNSPQGQLLANMLQGMENQLRNGHAPTSTAGFLGAASHVTSAAQYAGPSSQNAFNAPAASAALHSGPSAASAKTAQANVSTADSLKPTTSSVGQGGAHTAPRSCEAASSPVSELLTSQGSSQKEDPKKALADEIKREFSLLMALGNIGANEAAAEALKRVMAKRSGGKVLS